MDFYKDSVDERKDYREYILNIRRVKEMGEEEEEEDSIERFPIQLNEEIDAIKQSISSSSVSDVTEATNRLLYFSQSDEEEVYQIIFENNLIDALNVVFQSGIRMPVLHFIANMVKSTDEVVIQFIGTDLFRTLIEMIYEGEPETLKFITLIFINIIEKSTFVSLVIYCQGFLQEASEYIKENGMDNQYMEFFLANVCASLVKMRCPRDKLEFLDELREQLATDIGVSLDDFLYNDYIISGITLRYTSPLYTIIDFILNSNNVHTKTLIATIYTLNIFLQPNDAVGLDPQDCCNVILNELKFVQRVVDFVQSPDTELADATMRLIASILYTKSTIDNFPAEVFMEAVSLTIGSDIFSIQKMAIYILGTLACVVSDFSALASNDDIKRFIHVMQTAPFKVQHTSLLTILHIEVALETLEFHTFEMLKQIAEFIKSGIFITEQFLIVLEQLIKIDTEKNGNGNFMKNILDSGILESIEELLDSDDEKIQLQAEQFIEYYNSQDLENLDLDIDF